MIVLWLNSLLLIILKNKNNLNQRLSVCMRKKLKIMGRGKIRVRRGGVMGKVGIRGWSKFRRLDGWAILGLKRRIRLKQGIELENRLLFLRKKVRIKII